MRGARLPLRSPRWLSNVQYFRRDGGGSAAGITLRGEQWIREMRQRERTERARAPKRYRGIEGEILRNREGPRRRGKIDRRARYMGESEARSREPSARASKCDAIVAW